MSNQSHTVESLLQAIRDEISGEKDLARACDGMDAQSAADKATHMFAVHCLRNALKRSETIAAELAASKDEQGGDPVWRCQQCGELLNQMDPRWRWTGEVWQHHHDVVGHVDASKFSHPSPPSPAALVSNEPSAAQNGYVLAPIEPTEAMLRQVESNWSGFADTDAKPAARRLYKAMLQSAPRTPVSNDGKVSVSVGFGEVEFLIDQVHGMQCYCSGERIHIPDSWHGTKFSMQCRRCKTLDALRRARELAKAHQCGDSCRHDSDCAVHNAPAYPAGECDCGLAKAQKA